MLGGSALDDLAKQGKLLARNPARILELRYRRRRRAGLPKPDISSVDAFKRALLAAKTVAYTIEGASGIHFSGLIEKLGIAREVKAKEVRQPGGLVGELIAAGKAELAIQQIPELMAVAGIVYVGPLPAELQKTPRPRGAVFCSLAQPAGGAGAAGLPVRAGVEAGRQEDGARAGMTGRRDRAAPVSNHPARTNDILGVFHGALDITRYQL